MDPGIRNGFLLILTAAALVFLFIQRRKTLFRRIANSLGGKYHTSGIFDIGTINGRRGGRSFTVETGLERDLSRTKRFTTCSVDCTHPGIPLVADAVFFKKFPDWNHISTKGEKTEKSCFVDIRLSDALLPLDDSRKESVATFFEKILRVFPDIPAIVGKGTLSIDRTRIVLRIPGFIGDRTRAFAIIQLLRHIAETTEAALPCTQEDI